MKCCGSGMLYPGSESKHFVPGSYMKIGMQTCLVLFSCFLCFQEQSLSHSQKVPGSGKIFIPDPNPGGKKAPDPDSQHWWHAIIFVSSKCFII
jgi:hypothetical protein